MKYIDRSILNEIGTFLWGLKNRLLEKIDKYKETDQKPLDILPH